MYEPDLVQTFPASGITQIDVQLVAGELTIEATDRADVRILASGVSANPELIPTLRAESQTLRIDGQAAYALNALQEMGRVKLLIQLPRRLNVTLGMLTGTLQLTGEYETLDIRLRFGSIMGCAPARQLKIRVFAGDVRLGRLRGAADVQLSLGDLTMAWAHLDGGEEIVVQTFVGETVLDLPDHMTLVNGRAAREALPPTDGFTVTPDAEMLAGGGGCVLAAYSGFLMSPPPSATLRWKAAQTARASTVRRPPFSRW